MKPSPKIQEPMHLKPITADTITGWLGNAKLQPQAEQIFKITSGMSRLQIKAVVLIYKTMIQDEKRDGCTMSAESYYKMKLRKAGLSTEQAADIVALLETDRLLQTLLCLSPEEANNIVENVLPDHLKKSEDSGSVPVIDTTEQDRKRKEQRRKEDESTFGTGEKKEKGGLLKRLKNSNVKSRKYVTLKEKRLSGVMITKFRDGSILCKPQNSPPKDYDPGFDSSQQAKMLQMALDSLQSVTKPEKEKATAEKEMSTDKEITKSMPTITKADIARADAELDIIGKNINVGSPGHRAAAQKVGLDVSKLPAGTDVTKLSFQDMKALAAEQTRQSVANVSAQPAMTPAEFQKQQLEKARELEAQRNAEREKNKGIVAGCFAM
jgi:hypothetical protein